MNVKKASKYLQEQNKKFSAIFVEVPSSEWPFQSSKLQKVFRNRSFLVQVHQENDDIVRLSICRTELDRCGQWKDNISWDDLQGIKNACGYEDKVAVEIYPELDCEVNVANFRHLWVLPDAPAFVWGKRG